MPRAIVTSSSSSTNTWALHHLSLLLLLPLDPMSDIIEAAVINRFANIFDWTLWVGRGDYLVLPGQPVGAVRTLVGGQNANFSSGHFLLVDADGLADVVDLRLHLADGGGLQVEHLQEVVGQGVDLVGHTCQ